MFADTRRALPSSCGTRAFITAGLPLTRAERRLIGCDHCESQCYASGPRAGPRAEPLSPTQSVTSQMNCGPDYRTVNQPRQRSPPTQLTARRALCTLQPAPRTGRCRRTFPLPNRITRSHIQRYGILRFGRLITWNSHRNGSSRFETRRGSGWRKSGFAPRSAAVWPQIPFPISPLARHVPQQRHRRDRAWASCLGSSPLSSWE